MIFLLLTISGSNWEPEQIIREFQIANCTTWKHGEPMKHGSGRTYKDSGIALSLPDHPNWVEAMPEVASLLNANLPLFARVAAMGMASELSVGVTVGSDESFAPSLDFPTTFLAALQEASINLQVTCYPTSDE
jgi:hypothetical protein